jgi:hypothetical protein
MIVSTRTTAGAVGGPTFLSSTGIRIAECRGSDVQCTAHSEIFMDHASMLTVLAIR